MKYWFDFCQVFHRIRVVLQFSASFSPFGWLRGGKEEEEEEEECDAIVNGDRAKSNQP